MLCARNLGFAYDATVVLQGVSLDVAPGEVLCVVGPSGAGKSTLLRLLAGLAPPTHGQVTWVDGDPGAAVSPALHTVPRMQLAHRLAFLPQDVTLAFPLSVLEIVLLGRTVHHSAWSGPGAADRTAAQSALTQVGLADLGARLFHTLSGGERRRVLVAQALCQGAQCLLLDEPTASLDPGHALSLFGLLRTRAREQRVSVMASTHDLSLACRHADRVLVLAEGRSVGLGTPQILIADGTLARAFGVTLHTGALPGGRGDFVVPYT